MEEDLPRPAQEEPLPSISTHEALAVLSDEPTTSLLRPTKEVERERNSVHESTKRQEIRSFIEENYKYDSSELALGDSSLFLESSAKRSYTFLAPQHHINFRFSENISS
jgi:hypothetical protein